MYKQYLTCREAPPVPLYDAKQMAQGLGAQLGSFLFPLLVQLDAVLDKRLVRTFLATIEVMITFRDRANGLLLSELGGYLETPNKAPAGSKRRSRLAPLLQVGSLAHRALSSSSEPVSSWRTGGRPGRRVWSFGMKVSGRSRRVSTSRGSVPSDRARPSA